MIVINGLILLNKKVSDGIGGAGEAVHKNIHHLLIDIIVTVYPHLFQSVGNGFLHLIIYFIPHNAPGRGSR